jgi:hypothetical protein
VEQKKEEVLEAKRTRVPIHSSRGVLNMRGLDHENFQYRWVNKTIPKLVERFLDAGYIFVDADGKNLPVGDRKVDTTTGIGSAHQVTGKDGVTLVLMAIPIELYMEDQAAKRASVAETEESRYRDLQEMSDPRRGNYGGIGAFGNVGIDPGQSRPMVPKTRKV